MLKETWDLPWNRYILKLITEAELNYNTLLFLFFLIGFLAVYFLLRGSGSRRIWILIGNLIFYGWSGPGALLILFVTSLIAYSVTRRIERIYAGFDGSGMRPKERRVAFAAFEKRARRWITLALILIIGFWVLVKACRLAGFDSVEVADLMSGSTGIIVPLGISYYTLCTAAYVLDVYWQKTEAEHNYLKLFTAMTFFPCIVQGPFVRYQNIMKQFDELPDFSYTRMCSGLQLMIWGYFKKLVVADRLVLLTETIFSDPYSYAGIEIVIALFLGSFQLYADFSGCMDIIRGISEAMGIELPINFKQPFFAKSTADFWRRWHISLGDWTKEYIYLPIAMNAKFLKKGREIRKKRGALAGKIFSSFFPLFSVWLFTGLWHGTGWDYICWGMYWGLLIILAQITEGFFPGIWRKLHINPDGQTVSVWRMLRTFLIFTVGRMWTVTGLQTGFFVLWQQIFAEGKFRILTDGTIFTYGMSMKDFTVAIAGIAMMLFVDFVHERGLHMRRSLSETPLAVRWLIYYAAIMTIVIVGIYGPGYDAASFVYGNF